MARCPDCNKFVSFNEPEVEIDDDSPDVSPGTSSISVDVRIFLGCADCGSELKEYRTTLDLGIESAWCTCENSSGEWTWDNPLTGECFDRFEDKDRNGKPIKSQRYMKHYYGANISGEIKCSKCNNAFTISETVEEMASGFEDC